MYICLDCGCVFDEDEMGTYTEQHPYGMGYAGETFVCCPSCKGSFDEAVECKGCGEYFAKDNMHDEMCDKCFNFNKERIVKALAELFTKEEFNNLPDDMFDNIWEDVEKVLDKEEVK